MTFEDSGTGRELKKPIPEIRELNSHNFQEFFTPFFSFAIESYMYEMDFTLGLSKKYTDEILHVKNCLLSYSNIGDTYSAPPTTM